VYFDILKEVKKHVTIPVSVKLGYYFTNLCSVATRLVEEGADGLVLFNRYFRPDIDIDTLKVMPDTHMSLPEELNVPMRWIALMTGNSLPCDLAASTGVHHYDGVVKQILAGAKAVQLCSTLYLNGIPHIEEILKGLEEWMRAHRFNSIEDFRGRSLEEQTIDASFERIQFMRKDYE
jgi:dihydroorotate dehydrogenase (fumarate)